MELTKEEIISIHKKGYLTAKEIVQEWESFGLCAPCNSKGPKNMKCNEYDNCHDCLVDFASQKDEWISTYHIATLLGEQPMFNLKYVIKPKVLTKKKDD